MANPPIAKLIAEALPALPHPGNPLTRQEPTLIPLPAFRPAGMPPEMAEHVFRTAQAVGEAIVNVIETAGNTIIKTAELDQLRANEDQPGSAMPVVCASCKNPILYLRIVNGRALINASLLSKANLACPHTQEAAS